MSRRKHGKVARLRTVVVYRDGKVGYYSRDRIEGGVSPVYSSEAHMMAAREARAAAKASGTKGTWIAAH